MKAPAAYECRAPPPISKPLQVWKSWGFHLWEHESVINDFGFVCLFRRWRWDRWNGIGSLYQALLTFSLRKSISAWRHLHWLGTRQRLSFALFRALWGSLVFLLLDVSATTTNACCTTISANFSLWGRTKGRITFLEKKSMILGWNSHCWSRILSDVKKKISQQFS